MSGNLKLFYAAGPGNVIGTFEHWRAGRDDPSQVAMTYSGQFFDLCRELSAEGYLVAAHAPYRLLHAGQFTLEHLPKPWPKARGPLYHAAVLGYGLHLAARARRFRADAAVIAEGTTHWFLLSLLARSGVKVIPALHCLLWPKYRNPGRAQRLLNRLSCRFLSRGTGGMLSASEDISDQVKLVTRGQPGPLFDFLPTYRRDTFAAVEAPRIEEKPFRVLFAGRVERNKGVFDLLQIARRFAEERCHDIVFDLCGDGSALAALRAAVTAAGVRETFRVRGYCLKPEMQAMLNEAHVLIVPTTTDFIEGFNQVVVEGILAGRPVITSSVCPALSTVRDAVVEVRPDDVAGYGDAILALNSNERLYEEKREACVKYQAQFYAPELGWAAALRRALRLGGVY